MKSRKRTRNPERHKQFQQKLLVQSGLEHKTRSNKIKKGKHFNVQTKCGCKKNCSEKVSAHRQKKLFDTFYSLKNWSEKTWHIRSMVKCISPKEDLTFTTSKKRRSYKYFVPNESGSDVEVCFHFLLNCLQISKRALYNAIKSVVTNESAAESRGSYRPKKTDAQDIDFLKAFIARFPSYHSHYAATKSDKKYLHPNLNIRRMYKEYSIVCTFEKKKLLSEWLFRKVFNTKFNLGFHPKKVDTCHTCDKLAVQLQSENANSVKREQLQKQKENHLQTVKVTNQNFHDAVKFSRDEANDIEIFTIDLQRALELPSISTSDAFYLRQVWCYNLCVFDEKRGIGYMYFWNETIASRGAQEISSCLSQHFTKFVPENTKKIIIYSDACPGQNRNIKTTLMMKKILDSWEHNTLQTIEQRFFVSGHSYNSCDRCFGLIERQKKFTEQIYIPQHWMGLISHAKKNEPKFIVTEMKREDFISCEQLENIITNRKKTLNGEKVEWITIQKIINNRSSPFEFNFERYNVCSPEICQVSLKKWGKTGNLLKFADVNFAPLYTESRPITQKKYADLQKLIQYVPGQFQWFYDSLKCEVKETNTQFDE